MQTSPSVYIANLTAMTVGMSPDDAACPTEWIMDAAMPYPLRPEGECTTDHPATQCVPSLCAGNLDTVVTADSCTSTLVAAPNTVTATDAANCQLTPTTDFGVTPGTCADTATAVATCAYVAGSFSASTATSCAGQSTKSLCDSEATCTWYESCPKTLAPAPPSGAATAQDCITLSIPGTCTERAEVSDGDADATACAAVTGADLETPDACNAANGATVNPCEYAGKDWRCYLHFSVDQSLRGVPRVQSSTVSVPLKRCPLVGLPVIGEQYVFGITGTCAWRKGDFVALSEVPEAFAPMLSGEDTCPFVNTEGGGSVTLVIMLIVVFPLGSILLFALLVRFGPKSIFGGGKAEEAEGEEGGDANPAAKPPAAP